MLKYIHVSRPVGKMLERRKRSCRQKIKRNELNDANKMGGRRSGFKGNRVVRVPSDP